VPVLRMGVYQMLKTQCTRGRSDILGSEPFCQSLSFTRAARPLSEVEVARRANFFTDAFARGKVYSSEAIRSLASIVLVPRHANRYKGVYGTYKHARQIFSF
jgi:hypothetical protein